MMSYSQVFATPGAVAGTTLPESTTTGSIMLDTSVPDVTEQARNALGPLTWRFSVRSAGGAEPNQNQQTFAAIRDGLLAGSVFTLLLAGVSLFVLALEHMRERRRPPAALAATGVPTGTLARSLLWQNAVPMLLGVVVAVATGLGLAALVFQLINDPFTVDWAAVGLFSGTAAALADRAHRAGGPARAVIQAPRASPAVAVDRATRRRKSMLVRLLRSWSRSCSRAC